MFIKKIIIISAIFSLSACSIEKRVIEDLPRTFLEDVDLKSRNENLPFQHLWVKADRHNDSFNKVHFKPVRTDLLPTTEWEKSISTFITSEDDFKAEAAVIAEYFLQRIKEEIVNPENGKQKFSSTDSPDASTLVVEIALTELEFSHPIARAGSLIAPVPGTGAAISAISDPHVAFAARITDGSSGELLSTVADRSFAPARIIDLNKLTVSSSVREICSLWAKAIAESLNADAMTKVEKERFDILPW